MSKKSDQAVILKEPEPQPELGYSTGAWSGMPHYSCMKCPFDTLDLQRMEHHLKQHLPKPQPKPRSPILMADGSGNEKTQPLPEQGGDAFEIELQEIGSHVDENGVEHKTFTVKE